MLAQLTVVLLAVPLAVHAAAPLPTPAGAAKPLVTLPQGTLEGYIELPYPNKSVAVYISVPYAAPPVGGLRFAPPQPPHAWAGTRDAGPANRVTCFQAVSDSPDKEDCLYLDVYTPKLPGSNASAAGLLPVILYIHGGGWRHGSKNTFHGSKLAARGDVVIVSVNYRLGPLGFLSTEDGEMPGNYGVLDQRQAMAWCRNHIRDFGGDPDMVTIMGESAGAASVALHVFSPLSTGLFKRAIMQSACATTSREVAPPHAVPLLNVTMETGRQLGCDVTSSTALLACLRAANVSALFSASQKAAKMDSTSGPFRPRVGTDSGFMPDFPERLMARGAFNRVDTMRGFNAQEMGGSIKDPENDGITRDEFLKAAHAQLKDYPYVDADTYAAKLADVYVGNKTDPIKIRTAAIDMRSDLTYVSPIVREAMLTSGPNQPKHSYLYLFNQQMARKQGHPDSWHGVTHGMNNAYVLGNIGASSPDDKAVSDVMMAYWANFARTGNPVPHGAGLPRWPQVTELHPKYIILQPNSTVAQWISPYQRARLDIFKEMMSHYASAAAPAIVG